MSEIQQHLNLLEIAIWAINSGKTEMLPHFFVLAWGVWSKRNKWLYEHSQTHPKAAFDKAFPLQLFFSKCCRASTPNLNSTGCWQPPDNDFLKLNTNAVLFVDSQVADFGVVFRDSNGQILLATNIKEQVFHLLETTECIAILRNFSYLPLGIPKLIEESDSQIVVQDLQKQKTSFSFLHNIILDIKLLMSQF